MEAGIKGKLEGGIAADRLEEDTRMMDWRPKRFVSEEIEIEFKVEPAMSKKPGPPDAFTWRGERFEVTEMISRWYDFERRGRMARNMAPKHLREALRKGSWGVGRYFFRVRTAGDRIFDVYFDRAPQDAGDRAGHWYLWREMEEAR
jgi:hypothetical protein